MEKVIVPGEKIIVEVPGVGNLPFVSGLSNDEIAAKIKDEILPKPQETAGFLESVVQASAVLPGPLARIPTIRDALKGFADRTQARARQIQSVFAAGAGPPDFSAAAPPENRAEQLGQFGETAAEFMIPGLAAKGLLGAGNLLGRAAVEGIGSGAIAASQGDKPAEALGIAVLSGGLPLAAGMLKSKIPAIRESARKAYAATLAPSPEQAKDFAKRVIPELLARHEWTTSLPALLERAGTKMDAAAGIIEDKLGQYAGTKIDPAPVLDALKGIRDDIVMIGKKTVQSFEPDIFGPGEFVPVVKTVATEVTPNKIALKTIDSITAAFKDLGDDLSLETVRRFKQQLFDMLTAGDKAPVAGKMILQKQTLRNAAFAVRDELVKAVPDLDKLNAEFTFWKRVGDIVDSTLTRRVGHQPPLSRTMATVAGLATGEGFTGALKKGAIMNLYMRATRSDFWRTFNAVQKTKLADSIVSGRFEEAGRILRSAIIGLHQTPAQQQEQGQEEEQKRP